MLTYGLQINAVHFNVVSVLPGASKSGLSLWWTVHSVL